MSDMNLYIIRRNYHNEWSVVQANCTHTPLQNRPVFVLKDYWEIMAHTSEEALAQAREYGTRP